MSGRAVSKLLPDLTDIYIGLPNSRPGPACSLMVNGQCSSA